MPANSLDDCESCDAGVRQALQPLPPDVASGRLVVVRGGLHRLDAVVRHADCCELHLSDRSGAARRVLLWPFDRPAAAPRASRLHVLRLPSWIRAIGGLAAGVVNPLTPRVRAYRADVLPYQLEPAMAMASGAPRIVLADEVGLGKTVQAGWIVADLIERERHPRVLIAVPAGLRAQWTSELSRLFAIVPIAVDARWLRHTVADLPPDVSPWSAPGVYLGSVDFLKRPDVAASLEAQPWDLLVVDEAHAAAAPTDRHAALQSVAARARRIVAITATPFSGDVAAFHSMAALGEAPGDEPPIMFRRSREDVGDRRARRHRFAAVRITHEESRLQRLLERYSRAVWKETAGGANAARLAMTILRKRALSSGAASLRSLRRRLALLEGAPPAPRQLSFFDDELTADDELCDAALAARGLADTGRELRWLATLIDAAERVVARDSKRRCLLRLLRRLRGEAAIVFTEYRDTLLDLAAALPDALLLHGGLTAQERGDVQRRFNAAGGILLATDAAGEGLNLHGRCRVVINYELPWNPGRLEQRIGRVDRIGQRWTVHALTLVARDTAEDLVVASLARRLARVAATLGERDRLAAFLDDARTARLVIEGAPVAIGPAEEMAGVQVTSAPVSQSAVREAAREVLARREHARSDAVVVSSTRASRLLDPGVVFAFRVVVQTDDGDVVAERIDLVHVGGDLGRPRRARAVRALAAAAIERWLPSAAAAGPLSRQTRFGETDGWAWFEDAQHAHERAVERRLAREAALRDRSKAHGQPEVQPGLFDRRAVREAAGATRLQEHLRAAHDAHFAVLSRSLELQCSTPLAGVLIVWR